MADRSNIALSYIAMLTVVGFFLWVIRNFVRGLRQKAQSPPFTSAALQPVDREKCMVDWPVHIFLSKQDDIPIPGRMVSISLADAFMESSACLKTGQEIVLYVDVPGRDQVRLTAKVSWARASRDGRNAAQLTFPGQGAGGQKELLELVKDFTAAAL